MSDTPESPALRRLQEMRAEMHETRTEFRELRAEMRAGFDDLSTRLEGMAYILTLLAGHSRRHDAWLEKLEGRPGEGG